jgi:hypothetical protein
MSQEIDYSAVLADLEARKAALDAAIAAVKAILGQGTLETASSVSGTGAAIRSENALPQEVAPGVFHGMSISEAARKFLEMRKAKQKTRAIADAIRQGGIESGARDFYSNVYTTMARRPKEFIRLGKYWALVEWHPTRAAVTTAKPAKKGRRGRKSPKAHSINAALGNQKMVDISSAGEKAETA